MFADLKKSADDAVRGANEDTANELTKKFRAHLVRAGVPKKDAQQSDVVYDRETRDFKADVPEAIEAHTKGTADSAPSGVVTQFFNRLSDPQIDSIYNKHLLKRSKAGGLA